MNKALVRTLLIFVAVLLGSGLLVYVLLERSSSRGSAPNEFPGATTLQADPSLSPTPSTRVQERGSGSVLSEIFGIDHPNARVPEENDRAVVAARVLVRFLIAAFLAMLLAFRWRRGVPVTRRNPYVAQTQILLAMVAAALMMIVGDSAARAFGIFAAASLVRFRTNIKDPKEITVLLISLAIGLAAGVGRWELGLLLCVFALGLLWLLEYNEAEKVFRSMELTVKTRFPDRT